MSDPIDVIEQAVKVMAEHGFTSDGFSPHSWRCEYPKRYGHCSCPEELAQALADAGLLATKAGHPRTEPTPEVELARQAIQAQMNRAGT